MATRTPKSIAGRPAARPQRLDPNNLLQQTPDPAEYADALAEAETLVSLLTGFEVGPGETAQAAALRARGWALFHIDGETALPPGVQALHPLLAREFARLLHVAKSVISEEVLAAHHARRSIDQARRRATYLQDQIKQADALLGAIACGNGSTAELTDTLAEIEELVLPWVAAANFAAALLAGTHTNDRRH